MKGDHEWNENRRLHSRQRTAICTQKRTTDIQYPATLSRSKYPGVRGKRGPEMTESTVAACGRASGSIRCRLTLDSTVWNYRTYIFSFNIKLPLCFTASEQAACIQEAIRALLGQSIRTAHLGPPTNNNVHSRKVPLISTCIDGLSFEGGKVQLLGQTTFGVLSLIVQEYAPLFLCYSPRRMTDFTFFHR